MCDLVALGEVQVTVDCDVLQADGGTRTASICGAYVALHDAFTRMQQGGLLSGHPLTDAVAAVSVGIVDGVPMLDLPYEEDSRAEVDMNVVMTGSGRFVEVQGTAEGQAFSRGELDELLALAETGISQLLAAQAAVLAEPPPPGERQPSEQRPSAGPAPLGAGHRQPGQGSRDRRHPRSRRRRRAACPDRPMSARWTRPATPWWTTPA